MPACCIQLPTQFNWISPFKCQTGTSHSSVYTVPKWCPPHSSSSFLPPPTVPPVVSPSFRLFMPYLWITAGHLSFSHTPAQAISTPLTILIWLQSLTSGDFNDLLTDIYVSPCPTVWNNHCPFYGRPHKWLQSSHNCLWDPIRSVHHRRLPQEPRTILPSLSPTSSTPSAPATLAFLLFHRDTKLAHLRAFAACCPFCPQSSFPDICIAYSISYSGFSQVLTFAERPLRTPHLNL